MSNELFYLIFTPIIIGLLIYAYRIEDDYQKLRQGKVPKSKVDNKEE